MVTGMKNFQKVLHARPLTVMLGGEGTAQEPVSNFENNACYSLGITFKKESLVELHAQHYARSQMPLPFWTVVSQSS